VIEFGQGLSNLQTSLAACGNPERRTGSTHPMNSMKSETKIPENIDEYIAGFPSEVQAILQKVRTTIAKAAPGAREAIKYRLPTFVQNGNLVHFGAFQKHIGFFATPTGHAKFQRELSAYEGGKGSVQFPFGQPIPYPLIRKIAKFRVQEDAEKSPARKKKR
jgi:uncharacterized protein YdhG (YjbR/CyaY superfamily)